jgi:hypothetical protein
LDNSVRVPVDVHSKWKGVLPMEDSLFSDSREGVESPSIVSGEISLGCSNDIAARDLRIVFGTVHETPVGCLGSDMTSHLDR